MAQKSGNNYRKLNFTGNVTILDPVNEIISDDRSTSSKSPLDIISGSSSLDSAYISPDDSPSPSWLEAFDNLKLKPARSEFDSFDLSNIRVSEPPRDPWSSYSSFASSKEDSMRPHVNLENSIRNFQRQPLSNSTNTTNITSSSCSDVSDFTYSALSNEEKPFWDGYNTNYYSQEMQPECIPSAVFDRFRKPYHQSYEEFSFAPRINSTPNGSQAYEYFGYQQSFYSRHEMMTSVRENCEISTHIEMTGASQSANIPVHFKEPKKVPAKQKKSSKAKPDKKSLADHCVFCKNNGAEPAVYKSHTVKDSIGRTLCPKLRLYQCHICGADGDDAHTIKYCPKRKVFTENDMKKANGTPKCKRAFNFRSPR